MKSADKQQVITAIRQLGRRVTVADVATKTGLAVAAVTSQLNKIAEETGGHLQVGTSGDVAYKFSAGFQNAYLARGIKRILQQVGEKTLQAAFYLLRISFGIMLIISILIIVTVIVLIMLRGSNSDGRGRQEGFNFRLNFFDYLILRDLFYWGSHSSYPSRYRTGAYNRAIPGEKPKSNFLLDCFSFLFGDGNPNLDLEERRWRAIAGVIKQNSGVVTSEQLAPYTLRDPKSEDAVLPVLVRSNGRPEVTESGNIVYIFPALQISAAETEGYSTPAYLEERRFVFSNASQGSFMLVGGLATFNFLGSWWLWFLGIGTGQGPFAPLVISLAVYGTGFVVFPAVRILVNTWLNRRINYRNGRRLSYARLLDNPPEDLARKLGESRQFAIKEERISVDRVIYSTEHDALAQKLEEELDASP